ncbi:MAG: FAD-binding oxidoreductase [Burkholderiaceae bacterium]
MDEKLDKKFSADLLIAQLTEILGERGIIHPDTPEAAQYRIDMLKTKLANPRIIVRPANTAEVSAVMDVCTQHNVSVVPFGGNSGFCGGSMTSNDGTQVLLSLQRMNKVLEFDPLNNTMTVQAGCILAQVQALADDNNRLFPLSHGGEGSAQIGGCLSTNAGGNAVLRFGMARDMVLGLEVVLPDGKILNALRGLRKDNAGYDLKQLFLGTEGTLGIITAAVLKLYPKARLRETALIAVPSVKSAVELLAHLRGELGEVITAFEMLPRVGLSLAMQAVGDSTEPFDTAHDWQILCEVESSSTHFRLHDALEEALSSAFDQSLALDAVIAVSEQDRKRLWRLREGIALAAVGDPSSLKSDQSVPCSRIPDFVLAGSKAVARIVPDARIAPFGHIGDGNIHFNVWRPENMPPEEFRDHWPDLVIALEDVATSLGGSIAAEHGIGSSKRVALGRVKDDVAISLMQSLKSAIDPAGRLNPGKVVP